VRKGKAVVPLIGDNLLFRPASRALFKQLDQFAASGDYDASHLDQLRCIPEILKSRLTVYYLASLYLQLGDEATGRELLLTLSGSTPAMKKFYHILSFCRRSKLPLPKLSAAEKRCVDYLDAVINPSGKTIEQQLLAAGGFSIVGNAPGTALDIIPSEWCRFYFNGYLGNSRKSL